MSNRENPRKAATRKEDPRFAAVGTDPRFQRFPKKQKRVEIDERFAGMFTDPSFQQPTRVDKRGRKVTTGRAKNDIKAFYRLKDQDDDSLSAAGGALGSVGKADAATDVRKEPIKRRTATATQTKAQLQEVESSDAEEEEEAAREERRRSHGQAGTRAMQAAEEPDAEAARAAERYARLRGLADVESSSEEEEDDADAAVDAAAEEEAELAAAWGAGALAANPDEDVPVVSEDTSRLALVDLDWEKLRAVDILAALRSFVPAGGSIKRVTVYPSDYGLERMKQEAAEGPTGIYRSSKANGSESVAAAELGEDDIHSDGADAADDEDADPDGEEDSGGEDDDTDDDADKVDQDALRLYERSKLRWFYAVAECDSARTAAHLYAECDGMEFQLSACKFDLRFVPDQQSFEGREERDSATAVPDNYEPPSFQTVALQHTNVQLTWDADDDGRKRALSAKRATQADIREDDFKAYLASSSGDSSDDAGEDPNEKQKRLRALLLGSGDGDAGAGGSGRALGRFGGKGWAAATDDAADDVASDDNDARDREDAGRAQRDVDMEVVFQPGLEGLGERLLAGKRSKAARSSETVWDAYMRRRKEKREAAKAKGRKVDSDSDAVSDPEASPRKEGADQDGHDPFFQHEDNVFDDPWFASNDGAAADKEQVTAANGHQKADRAKSKKRDAARAAAKEAAAEQERRKADLEMLMMPDAELGNASALKALNGHSGAASSQKKLSRKDRIKQKKARKAATVRADSDEDAAADSGAPFQADLTDPRFRGLFQSQDFAIDPTDPRFKQMGIGASAMSAAIAKQRSRVPRPAAPAAPHLEASAGHREGLQLDAAVAGLKRKLAGGQGGTQRTEGSGKKSGKRKQSRKTVSAG